MVAGSVWTSIFVGLGALLGGLAAEEKTPSPQKVPILREWKANYSGVDQAARVVIRDAKAWADLWEKVHSHVDPKPAVPEVDFDKNVILAVFLGARRTGGYSIRIRDIVHDPKTDKLHVTVEEIVPPPGSIVTQAFTQPYHIVVIPKVGKDVEFGPEKGGKGESGNVRIVKEWRGSQCGVQKPAQLVIRDAKAWADLWEKVHSHVDPKPAVPEVDFDKHLILAAFSGRKPTGGFGIQIREIVHDPKSDKLRVTVEEIAPRPGGIVIQVITHPYHIVVIPKVGKEVEFHEVRRK